MGRRGAIGWILAIVLLMLAVGSRAHAAVADFQYATAVRPGNINSSSSVPAQGSIVTQNSVTDGVVFNAKVNPGGADVVVGTIRVTDLGIGAYTDTYGPTPFTVTFSLLDFDSNHSGLFFFNGTLSGSVASNGTTSAATFNNPFTATSQTQTIGATTYTVSIIPSKAFAAPGSPPVGGTGLNGTYTFNVSVPEPSGLALAGLAALSLLRRRARNRALASA